MRFVFSVYGDEQVNRRLLRVADYAGDASPAFEAISDRIREINREQFDSEGARSSGGWPDIALSTKRAKARLRQDPRILHATLALRNSLTVQGAADQLSIIQPHQMIFASLVPYGKYHREKRPPMEFTEADRLEFMKILQRFILTGRTL